MANKGSEYSMEWRVLVVDDETHFLSSIRFLLAQMGIRDVQTCSDSRQAMDMFLAARYDAVLLDVSMPHVTGTFLLCEMKKVNPEVPVLMITAVNEVESAVTCIKTGAFDYLVKPIEEDRLIATLADAIQLSESRRENQVLREKMTSGALRNPEVFRDLATINNRMLGIFWYIEAIASSMQPVLITGETGTGKELTARAIHNASGKEAPFVAVNIASVAENLIDDELFGHSKGAFTGAQTERAGMVEKASGGTLFLDEIGDLSTAVQVKLLRLIQERQYQRLGSDEVRTTNARIVAATNSSLGLKVKNEAFRADLYYRLATHRIHLPPLRDRKDDIPILVDSFLESAALEMNKNKPTPPKQLFTLLSTYDFPGNVRELRSMIFDAVSLHQSGTLSMDSFRSKVQKTSCDVVDANAANTDENKKIQFSGILPTLKEAQDILIDEALKAADGNQTIAAGILGMSRRALNSRLSRQQSKEL